MYVIVFSPAAALELVRHDEPELMRDTGPDPGEIDRRVVRLAGAAPARGADRARCRLFLDELGHRDLLG